LILKICEKFEKQCWSKDIKYVEGGGRGSGSTVRERELSLHPWTGV